MNVERAERRRHSKCFEPERARSREVLEVYAPCGVPDGCVRDMGGLRRPLLDAAAG